MEGIIMGKSSINGSTLSWLLITSITVLFSAFMIMSCGTGVDPQLKVQKMSDMSLDTNGLPDTGGMYVGSPDLFNMADIGLTVEAWIKNLTSGVGDDLLSGAILSRNNTGGVQLYMKRDIPKFKLVLNLPGKTATITVAATTPITSASGWTHVAGVLADEDHNDGDPDDHLAIQCKDGQDEDADADGDGNDVGGESEVPHLDIYVDGVLKACNTTYRSFGPVARQIAAPPRYAPNDTLSGEGLRDMYVGYLGNEGTANFIDDNDNGGTTPNDTGTADVVDDGDDVFSLTQFKGRIDEVRFWKTARTQSQIQNCMNKELDLTDGECGRSNDDLGGYWMFNEADGKDTTDYSGNGFSGTIYSPHGIERPNNNRSTDVPF